MPLAETVRLLARSLQRSRIFRCPTGVVSQPDPGTIVANGFRSSPSRSFRSFRHGHNAIYERSKRTVATKAKYGRIRGFLYYEGATRKTCRIKYTDRTVPGTAGRVTIVRVHHVFPNAESFEMKRENNGVRSSFRNFPILFVRLMDSYTTTRVRSTVMEGGG